MKRLGLLTISIALALMLPGAAAGADAVDYIGQGDAAWEMRGADGTVENGKAAELYLAAVAAAPHSYEAHWKAARCFWWIADQRLLVSDDRNRQRELATRAMGLSARAMLISPDGVQGHLYWALSALHYCYGIGMVGALKEGIQDKAADHLILCYEKDKSAEGGLALLGLSALYRTTPRPLRDVNRAVGYAREAESMPPGSIRKAVFLAAALGAAGLGEESLAVLDAASKMDGDPAQEPDFRWWKRFARTCVEKGKVPDPDKLL